MRSRAGVQWDRGRGSVQRAVCSKEASVAFLSCPGPQTGDLPRGWRTELTALRWFIAQPSQRPTSRTRVVCGHDGALNWESEDLGSRPPSYQLAV